MQPMYENPPYSSGFPLGAALLAVGVVGLVLGFAIIQRLTRDPEEGPDHWRSHRRRVNWTAIGYVVWTVLFIEGAILVFMPAIKLWLANH
jgi:hypothetical protein